MKKKQENYFNVFMKYMGVIIVILSYFLGRKIGLVTENYTVTLALFGIVSGALLISIYIKK